MVSKEFESLKPKQRSIFEPMPSVLRNPVYSKEFEKWPKPTEDFGQQIVKVWEMGKNTSFWQSYAYVHQNKAICLMNTITGYITCNMYRKTLGLTKPSMGVVNILFPSIVGSFLLEILYHAKNITVPMTLKIHEDHLPFIMSGLGLHLSLSCLYQLSFITVGSVYFANMYNTFPLPEDYFSSKSGRKFVFQKVILPTLKQNRNTLVGLFAFNAAFAFGLTSLESQQLKDAYSSLEKKL